MRALRVYDFPCRLVGVFGLRVQRLVQFAQTHLSESNVCILGGLFERGAVYGSRNRRLRARVPKRGRLRSRAGHQRAVFGPKGHVLIGFGHHRGLARDRVTHHAKAVFGANHKGKEAVQIIERCFPAPRPASHLLHLPCQIGRADFGVVLGFDVHTFAAQFAAQEL